MADNISKYNASRTAAERHEQAQAAGIRSGEIRRENRQIKELVRERMSDDDLTEIVDNLIFRAKRNLRDFVVLRDTIGEKPADNMAITASQGDPFIIRVHRADAADELTENPRPADEYPE